MLETFSSINYMSDRTSPNCSKCKPSRLGVSDFVCLTPQGYLRYWHKGGGGGGACMKGQIQTQNFISELLVHDVNLSPKNMGAKFCF